MCRLVAYHGPEVALEQIIVAPPHSLLEQSQAATEAKLSVNGDGFGISWYGDDPEPGLYRDVLPAWSDGNLLSLCRMIKSRLFLAHVRASTTGGTSRVNCHPFSHGPWTFMHNGQIGSFKRMRRELEAILPDELYDARQGSTDSELLFMLMIAHGLENSPKEACEAVVNLIRSMHDSSHKPDRLTCVFSNGEHLFAFRTSGDRQSPTLYICTGDRDEPSILASEPLDGNPDNWTCVGEDQFLQINHSDIIFQPLHVGTVTNTGSRLKLSSARA